MTKVLGNHAPTHAQSDRESPAPSAAEFGRTGDPGPGSAGPSSRECKKERSARVLLVSRSSCSFAGSKGGADVVARSTAEMLAEAGLPTWYVGNDPPHSKNVEWIPSPARVLSPRPREKPRSAALRYLFNELINVGRASVRGLRAAPAIRPDVVISNHPVTTMLFRLAHPRARILYRMHDGIHAQNGVSRFIDRTVRFLTSEVLERLSVGLASYVITPGERVRQELLALNVPVGKISALYPIVDWMTVSDPTYSAPSPTPRVPSTPSRFVLSIGQQTGRKRFDLLIEALRHLAGDLDLVLVGDGPLHERYRRRVEELGLQGRVTFVTDASDQRVRDLYRDCTIYALLSENEGFPVTVAEALASGVPTLYACPTATDAMPRVPAGLIVEGTLPRPVDLARLLDGLVTDIEEGGFPTRERIGAWAKQAMTTREGAVQTYLSAFVKMGSENLTAIA